MSRHASGLVPQAPINNTRAGKPFEFTIQARDAYGNDAREPCFLRLEAERAVVQGEHVPKGSTE